MKDNYNNNKMNENSTMIETEFRWVPTVDLKLLPPDTFVVPETYFSDWEKETEKQAAEAEAALAAEEAAMMQENNKKNIKENNKKKNENVVKPPKKIKINKRGPYPPGFRRITKC